MFTVVRKCLTRGTFVQVLFFKKGRVISVKRIRHSCAVKLSRIINIKIVGSRMQKATLKMQIPYKIYSQTIEQLVLAIPLNLKYKLVVGSEITT